MAEHRRKRSKAQEPKAFDIFKPSKIRPQTSSRPIIVANRPEQVDPMVKKQVDKHKTQKTPTPKKTEASEQVITSAPEVDTSDLNLQQESEEIDALAATEAARQQEETPEPEAAPEQTQSSVPGEAHDALPAVAEDNEAPLLLEAGDSEQLDDDVANVASEVPQESAVLQVAHTEEPTISFHTERKPKKKSRKVLHWVIGILIVLGFIALVIDILLDSALWIPNFVIPHTEILQHIKSSRSF